MKTVTTEDLFADTHARRFAPLADRLRPQSLDQLSGQLHLLGKERSVRYAHERSDKVPLGCARNYVLKQRTCA